MNLCSLRSYESSTNSVKPWIRLTKSGLKFKLQCISSELETKMRFNACSNRSFNSTAKSMITNFISLHEGCSDDDNN